MRATWCQGRAQVLIERMLGVLEGAEREVARRPHRKRRDKERIGPLRGVTMDVSTVHDLHGSADNPSLNGTLRHQDLDLALSQRAQAKVDKYREGYAAPGLRHAFLPAIVSTSGRIHGELLRLLFDLADKKTSNYFVAIEAKRPPTTS